VKLGKALFWDMQTGSDGRTACASCHYNAGADNRSRNQINPRAIRAWPRSASRARTPT
jgi:cytochrome c peroxidase